MNSQYEEPFKEFMITPGAFAEWQRFVDERSGLDAVIELQRLHVEQVRSVIAANGGDDPTMGFFVTSIPDHDLALVDLHGSNGLRHVTLMDQTSAAQLLILILNRPTGEILH